VPDAGGAPQPLTRIEKGEFIHRWPEFLPGGKAVLFAGGRIGGSKIAVHAIGKGDRRDLVQGGTSPHYATSGHLVYLQAGNLMAVPFDSQRLAVTGSAIPAVEGVLQSPNGGAAQYSFSSTGTLVYVPGAFSRPKADWCGSIAMGQSSPWPPLRGPMRSLGLPPTAVVSPWS
jgi:hypothetical protein